ncbi:MAG: hypothetical protein JOZ53_21355, partial [Planctomycetaceae bacterium]|nr:hypothetical protein [Planctomycetaceae bacterium]
MRNLPRTRLATAVLAAVSGLVAAGSSPGEEPHRSPIALAVSADGAL